MHFGIGAQAHSPLSYYSGLDGGKMTEALQNCNASVTLEKGASCYLLPHQDNTDE